MDPAAISTGMGEGMAQIFKPQEDFLGEAMKAAEAKKKESAANKARAMETLNKMAEYHVWTERDGAEFAKKQKEVWDGLQGKDLDDPNTMLWLNQKQQELTYLADRSNQDRELYKKAADLYAAKPTKYFDDSIINLQEFANPNNALGAKKSYNPLWMSERSDFDADLKKMQDLSKVEAEKNARQTVAEVGAEGVPGATRRYLKTTDIEKSTKEYADRLVQIYVSDPNNYKTVQERMQGDPNGAKYNGDVVAYAIGEISPTIVYDKYKESATGVPIGGFGAGGGGMTQGGYSITKRSEQTPEMLQATIESAAKNLMTTDAFKTDYQIKKKNRDLPKMVVGDKTQDMTEEQYALEKIKETELAKQQKAGYTYDFSRASKSGEPAETGFLDVPLGKFAGISMKPNAVTFDENREPIIEGLDRKGKKIQIPYSDIHAKLMNETGGDWQQLKKIVIDEVGFDPFTKYESKTAPSGGAKTTTSTTTVETKPTTNVKRDAAGNTYGGGAKEPTYTIKGKKYTLSELKDMGYTEQQVESYKNK